MSLWSEGDLLTRNDSGVLLLTLNRPARRNALSGQMLARLDEALRDAEADDDVRVVVLTGSGTAFCAGGDVQTMADGQSELSGSTAETSTAERIARQQQSQRATSVRLWQLSKPTIAAVPGPAAGAGLALALACDLRYAAPTARLVTGFINIGLAGDFGCSWLLATLVGPAKAKELLFFSDAISVGEAVRLGLVNEVLTEDDFLGAALTRARRLADQPRLALSAIKENVSSAMRMSLIESADEEVVHHVALLGTEEHRRLAKAFVNRDKSSRA